MRNVPSPVRHANTNYPISPSIKVSTPWDVLFLDADSLIFVFWLVRTQAGQGILNPLPNNPKTEVKRKNARD